MKTLNKVTALTSLTLAFLSTANASSAAYEEALKKRHCAVKLGTFTAEFQRMQKIWFAEKDSRFNIALNFEALKEKHNSYLDQVKQFRDSFSKEVVGLSHIDEQIRSLDSRFAELHDQLSVVVKTDHTFLVSLNLLHQAVGNLTADVNSSLEQCDALTEGELGNLATETSKWRDQIEKLQSFTAMTREKRKKLVTVVHESIRLNLETAWARKAGEDLSALHKRIEKLLNALALQRSILHWYRNLAVSNSVSNLRNQYLQYENPLAALRAGLQEGKTFLSKLDAMGLSSDVDGGIRNELNSYIATLQSSLQELESRGWKGTFERQKLLNQKRLSMLEKLKPGCRSSIEKYNKKATKVTTLAEFRTVESLYVSVFDNCKLK